MVDFPRKYESRDCIPLCLIINLHKAMSNAKVAHFIIAYHQMMLYHLRTLLQTCPRLTTLFARPQGSASSYLWLCFIQTCCRWRHTLLVWIFILEHRRSLSSPSSGFLSICTPSHLPENIHEAFFILSLEAHTYFHLRRPEPTSRIYFWGAVLFIHRGGPIRSLEPQIWRLFEFCKGIFHNSRTIEELKCYCTVHKKKKKKKGISTFGPRMQ